MVDCGSCGGDRIHAWNCQKHYLRIAHRNSRSPESRGCAWRFDLVNEFRHQPTTTRKHIKFMNLYKIVRARFLTHDIAINVDHPGHRIAQGVKQNLSRQTPELKSEARPEAFIVGSKDRSFDGTSPAEASRLNEGSAREILGKIAQKINQLRPTAFVNADPIKDLPNVLVAIFEGARDYHVDSLIAAIRELLATRSSSPSDLVELTREMVRKSGNTPTPPSLSQKQRREMTLQAVNSLIVSRGCSYDEAWNAVRVLPEYAHLGAQGGTRASDSGSASVRKRHVSVAINLAGRNAHEAISEAVESIMQSTGKEYDTAWNEAKRDLNLAWAWDALNKPLITN